MVLMVVVLAVGGRDGGGGTPHSENVPTHSASLDGGADPSLGQQPPPLDWIGLNSLGLEPNPARSVGV